MTDSRPRPWIRTPLFLLVGTLLLAACGETTTPPTETTDVTVMTRNLYLGADIFRVTQATAPEEIPAIVAEIFQIMEMNDFPARAGALAAEIEAHEPHLIGLQEVELYRIQDPSDMSTPATDVYLDFLEVLMDSLQVRGLQYQVASQVVNADVQMPAARSPTEFFDVRMTDRDVILARADVATRNPGAQGFQAIVPFELVTGDTIWFERGYTWVDATVDGADFTFVNTHLEVSAGGELHAIQSFQILELIQQFGQRAQVVLVGDLNTGPGDEPYELLTGTFTDAWTALDTTDPGLTCCFPELLNLTGDLYSRIDLILYSGTVAPLSAEVVGTDPAGRTPGGLWPSDHAGVVANLRIQH